MLKLGKLPKKNDPRNLKMARYMAEAPVLPVGINWSLGIDYPMYANDQVGDCSCASNAHAVLTWTRNSNKPDSISDQDVLGVYKAVTGYNGNPDTDRGAVLLDVLNYVRQSGIGGHNLLAFTEINRAVVNEIKAAIAWFGGAEIGVQLFQSNMNAFTYGRPWDTISGAVMGGHAVWANGYNSDGINFATWGKETMMTWPVFMNICDEAYALVSSDWIEQCGAAPNAMNMSELENDLNQITSL